MTERPDVPVPARFGAPPGTDAASDSERALTWHPPGGEPLTLAYDETGTVLAPLRLDIGPLALAIPAGARLTQADDDSARLDGELRFGPGDESVAVDDVTIALGGPDPGRVTFTGELPPDWLQASIRYFWIAPNESTPRGLRYDVFAAAARTRAAITIQPARPADGEANRLGLLDDESGRATFVSTAGRAVTLALLPERSFVASQWDPSLGTSYFTLDGDYRLEGPTAPTGPAVDLLLGLSGLEFGRVPDPAVMQFVAGAPAFAPGFGTPSPTSLTSHCPTTENPVTTAWVYFADDVAPGVTGGYYCEPLQAGMFQRADGDPALHQAPLRAASFPPGGAGVLGAPRPSFPAVPYAGATREQPDTSWDTLARFEQDVLSPERTRAIDALNGPAAASSSAAAAGPSGLYVTPQGFLSQFDSGGDWMSFVAARATGPPGVHDVQFKDVKGALRRALLSSQLFLVVSSPEMLQDWCTPSGELLIDGWRFQVDLSNWSRDPGTILIVKACAASIAELAAHPERWTEASAFNTNPDETAKALAKVVADAAHGGEYFARTVMHDWNGVLYLNVPIPSGAFPPELAGLAAGMHGGPLLAHHLGIDGSPIHAEVGLGIGQSTVFALIDYADPGDLDTPDDYAFKVLSLRVAFANSHITAFHSEVELLVRRLFGEPCQLVDGKHGDNLLFLGTWQRHGSESSYSFRTTEADLFTITSEVLETLTVTGAEFTTVAEPAQDGSVRSLFTLAGTLRFEALTDFDVFSFGTRRDASSAVIDAPGLAVANLAVEMRSDANGNIVSLRFDASGALVDLGRSGARGDALYTRFPLRVTSLIQGGAATDPDEETPATPAELGYSPVATPLTAGPLSSERWYGLAMDLDFGAAGGLAQTLDMTGSLLAAWSPSPSGTDVQVGLRFPGAQEGGQGMTIMGPLRLNVGKIRFLREASGAYLLRLDTIALGFLGLRFPPGGRTNLLLFGNPDPRASGNRLGWYGAYKKDQPKPLPPPRST